MGPRLGRVEYFRRVPPLGRVHPCFNGATLRTRGIPPQARRMCGWPQPASMGPRLGRVEYSLPLSWLKVPIEASMGTRLGRVEYQVPPNDIANGRRASMGPRLGRVEYVKIMQASINIPVRFNGATLRTRGIRVSGRCREWSWEGLQWGHA